MQELLGTHIGCNEINPMSIFFCAHFQPAKKKVMMLHTAMQESFEFNFTQVVFGEGCKMLGLKL